MAKQHQLVTRAFKCNARTMQRLQERYHATNSSNDCTRSARPRVTSFGRQLRTPRDQLMMTISEVE